MGQSRSMEILVGLFVTLGVAAAFLLTFRVSNLTQTSAGESYQVHAYFQNVGGLKPGSVVRLAGVKIGRVGSIEMDQERFEAKVSLNLESEYEIPADSSISILTAGLLGEQYLGLTPGGDPDPLADGDEIEFTQSALILEQIISQVLFSKASETE